MQELQCSFPASCLLSRLPSTCSLKEGCTSLLSKDNLIILGEKFFPLASVKSTTLIRLFYLHPDVEDLFQQVGAFFLPLGGTTPHAEPTNMMDGRTGDKCSTRYCTWRTINSLTCYCCFAYNTVLCPFSYKYVLLYFVC